MISVIICSVRPEMLTKVKENIKATIGVNFEFIIIDNRFERKGICKVYNQAVKLANFEILCFIHEDILIHSYNWGQSLANLILQKDVGLVGVSGSVYKSAYSAAWPACDSSFYRINTIQHFKNQKEPVTKIINPLHLKHEEVAVLDGVFLATKKSIIKLYPFDEKNFTNFHCYDLDISLNIGLNYLLVVTYDILLEHFSEGDFSKVWFEDNIKLHKKWRNLLPKQIGKVGEVQKKRSDFLSCQSFLHQVLTFSHSKKMMLYYYFRLVLGYWKFNHLKYSKTVFKRIVKSNN